MSSSSFFSPTSSSMTSKIKKDIDQYKSNQKSNRSLTTPSSLSFFSANSPQSSQTSSSKTPSILSSLFNNNASASSMKKDSNSNSSSIQKTSSPSILSSLFSMNPEKPMSNSTKENSQLSSSSKYPSLSQSSKYPSSRQSMSMPNSSLKKSPPTLLSIPMPKSIVSNLTPSFKSFSYQPSPSPKPSPSVQLSTTIIKPLPTNQSLSDCFTHPVILFFLTLLCILLLCLLFVYTSESDFGEYIREQINEFIFGKHKKGKEEEDDDSEEDESDDFGDENDYQQKDKIIKSLKKLEEDQTIKTALQQDLPQGLFSGDYAGSAESCLNGSTTNGNVICPDKADSIVQSNKAGQSNGKAGWCYIGEDRGFKSCAFTDGTKPKCMSGQVFPTLELCKQSS